MICKLENVDSDTQGRVVEESVSCGGVPFIRHGRELDH
jgi:hypothetical protein